MPRPENRLETIDGVTTNFVMVSVDAIRSSHDL